MDSEPHKGALEEVEEVGERIMKNNCKTKRKPIQLAIEI